MTPPHDLELSLGPRNHGNRGCPSIWSWWNILLVPNWAFQSVPNQALFPFFLWMPSISRSSTNLNYECPQFPKAGLKQAGGLLFSNNSNWIVSAGAQSSNFAGRVSAGAQSSNFGRRFCCCPIQLFCAGLKHLLYIFRHMILTFLSVQDSIVVSTPGFHPRGPGAIPWVGVESISKNEHFFL